MTITCSGLLGLEGTVVARNVSGFASLRLYDVVVVGTWATKPSQKVLGICSPRLLSSTLMSSMDVWPGERETERG
eukprot:COSAG03_NODE_1925_length_3351_cov_1.838561_2_plen_75_part_00